MLTFTNFQGATGLCQDWLDDSPLFLDTETTGIDAWAEIVELAVVDRDGTPLFNSLLRPSQPIPYSVTAIHGISNEMVENAPTWADVFPELDQLLTGRTLVAYNSPFDSRMIGQTCAIHDTPPIPANWVCAMRMYQRHARHARWVNLGRAARECGVVLDGNLHRALADTLLCLGIVRSVAEGS